MKTDMHNKPLENNIKPSFNNLSQSVITTWRKYERMRQEAQYRHLRVPEPYSDSRYYVLKQIRNISYSNVP